MDEFIFQLVPTRCMESRYKRTSLVNKSVDFWLRKSQIVMNIKLQIKNDFVFEYKNFFTADLKLTKLNPLLRWLAKNNQ